MNLSRFAIVFLALVPTALFIAAAQTAPDPAPQKPPAQKSAATPPADASAKPSPQAATAPATAALPESAPLRTAMPNVALPGSGSADEAATAAILSAIRADPGMAGSDVSVHTDNGVVTITGLVRNREQSAIASAYANRQLGVLRVDNQLALPSQ